MRMLTTIHTWMKTTVPGTTGLVTAQTKITSMSMLKVMSFYSYKAENGNIMAIFTVVLITDTLKRQ